MTFNYLPQYNETEMTTNPRRKIHASVNTDMIKRVRKHLEKEYTAKKIAEEEDISVCTAYRLIDKIARNLTDAEILGQKKGRPKNDVANIKREISRILLQDNSFIQRELSEELQRLDITKSQSTISRLLKDMNFSRKRLVKVPMERNSVAALNNRQDYARRVQFISDENLVFLDETGLNLHQTRNYGYSPKNTKAYKVVKGNRGKNISCMVAINNRGVIAFDTRDGAYDGNSFIEFINRKLCEHFENNLQDILIMDNCRFHHKRDVIELLRVKNINHMFLPPYSPQLNPIEEYFSHFKSRLVSIHPQPSSRDELKIRILDILNKPTVTFNGWFVDMRRYIEKALARHEFI